MEEDKGKCKFRSGIIRLLVLGRKAMPGLLYLGKGDFTVTEVVSPSAPRCCQGSDSCRRLSCPRLPQPCLEMTERDSSGECWKETGSQLLPTQPQRSRDATQQSKLQVHLRAPSETALTRLQTLSTLEGRERELQMLKEGGGLVPRTHSSSMPWLSHFPAPSAALQAAHTSCRARLRLAVSNPLVIPYEPPLLLL